MKYNIGVLIDSIYDEYENKLWYELVEIAKSRDINLITLVGGAIHSPYELNCKRNVTYNLVTRRNIDGLISFSATIGGFATQAELVAFLGRFSPIPIVNIGVAPPGYPAILIDNQQGMQQLMQHLLAQHHYRRIAFIKGPEGNAEADLRFRVYCRMLEEQGLGLDERLIVPGDFCRISGALAITTLLDERKAAFECVVAANDYMAIDAMKELQNRGVRVPEDIAVVGFDDLQESSCLMHPLTTVRQPIYDIAHQALDRLIRMLGREEQGTDVITLPAQLVVRRSCGCFIDIESEDARRPSEDLRQLLEQEMQRNLAESLGPEIKRGWAKRLLVSFTESMRQGNQKTFLIALEDILIQSNQREINLLTWFPVVSALFSHAQESYQDDKLFHLLWKGALIVVGNLAKQAEAHVQIFKHIQNEQLHLLYEAFRNIFDPRKRKLFMSRYLPQLNIDSFYLGLYPAPGNVEEVTLLIAYEKGRNLATTEERLAIHDVLADALRAGKGKKVLVVYPIYSDHEQLGLAVIEDGPQDGIIYESMGAQLNLAIYEAKLFRQVQAHAQELEKQVKDRTLELRLLNKELELKSKLDGLTNLYNRTAIYEFLEDKLTSQKVNQWISDKTTYILARRATDKAHSAEKAKPPLYDPAKPAEGESLNFAIIMLDIDLFKQINDTYGHLFGDKVLRVLSDLLQSPDIFRRQDLAGRYGGEEFIVILPDTRSGDARRVARRFASQLSRTPVRTTENQELYIEVSMGISENYPGDSDNEEVISRADKALYYAKEHGRNKIIVYHDVFETEAGQVTD